MRRGEIYWASLEPRSDVTLVLHGSNEQRGERPVLLISDDTMNREPRWSSLIVVPISSSKTQAARSPTVVPINAGESGLTRDSVIICHQITTLDRSKLGRLLGRLDETKLELVNRGLTVALGLLGE